MRLLAILDRQARGTWLVAVLSLLLAGMLGSAHRAVHIGLPAAASVAGSSVPTGAHKHGHGSAAHDTAAHAHGAGPFGQHDDGSAQCRLLDQLLHLDVLCVDPAPAPLLPATEAPPARVLGLQDAAAPRHYLARAPPRA